MIETTKKPNSQLTITNGLILGFLLVVLSAGSYAMGHKDVQNPNKLVSWLSLALMVGMPVYAIWQIKKNNGGYLTLGQGLKTGIGVVLIASLLNLIYTLVFMHYIEPDTINQILINAEEQMLDQGYDDEQIEQGIAMTKKFMMPMLIAGIVIWSLFIGFVISMIASLAMQHKDTDDY